MAEMEASKTPHGVRLNGDHAQFKVRHMAAPSGAAAAAAAANATGPESTQCRVCCKRVYEMEKLVADNMVYHKTCFKCCKCTRTLRVGNYASMDAQIFCKPHFIECFKQKGNYEEGFGRERHKNKWLKSEEGSENEADEADGAKVLRAMQELTCAAEPLADDSTSQPPHAASAALEAVLQPSHLTAGASTSASASDDHSDGLGVDNAEEISKGKSEAVIISLNEKKSKFFQAVAEGAKPKDYKPQPGKLKNNIWCSQLAADSAAAPPKHGVDSIGAGKLAAVSDKKAHFEAAATQSQISASAQPVSVTLRPRRTSPARSSENWRRSASVDDYDGRWALSSGKASGGKPQKDGPDIKVAGERQSRSTTRSGAGSKATAAFVAPTVDGTEPSADGMAKEPPQEQGEDIRRQPDAVFKELPSVAESAAELPVVEQKRKAFQLRQSSDATGYGERRVVPGVGGSGGSLKHKMEEFERRSAEQAEAARRDAQLACTKSKHEHETQPALPDAALHKSPSNNAACDGGSHPVAACSPSGAAVPADSDHGTLAVEEEVVAASQSKSLLETVPSSVVHEETQDAASLEPVPQAAEEGSRGAMTNVGVFCKSDNSPLDDLGSAAVVVADVGGGSEWSSTPDMSIKEDKIVEIASIKSKFEAGADSNAEAAYRSAAREEVDLIRGASAAGSSARSRYERALEETSRSSPSKHEVTLVLAGSADHTDSAQCNIPMKPAAEVAAIKSRFECGLARDDQEGGLPCRDESSAARAAPSSGSARLRYQKALEDSSSKPVPKVAVPDVPTKSVIAVSAAFSSGVFDVEQDKVESDAASLGNGDGSEGLSSDASKAVDLEIHSVPVSSLKSKFEVGSRASASTSPEHGHRTIALVADADTAAPPGGGSAAARYQKALEESTAKPIAKVESQPTAKGAVRSSEGGGSSFDSVDAKPAPSAVAAEQTTATTLVPKSEHSHDSHGPGEGDSAGAALPEQLSSPKEDVHHATSNLGVVSEMPSQPLNTPLAIDLQAKSSASSALKSPPALSPEGAASSTVSNPLHRILNKFEMHSDAQQQQQQQTHNRPVPKQIKIPNFERRRPSGDSGDTKAHAAVTSPSFLTKSTKSIKEKFEAHEPSSQSSVRTAKASFVSDRRPQQTSSAEKEAQRAAANDESETSDGERSV